MLNTNLLTRLLSRLSAENRELIRLSKLPRGTPASSGLISPRFQAPDGASFAAQYRQIFRNHAFAFLPATESPLIVDCGANIGVFTVYCRLRYPTSRIVAFEPDAIVFNILQRNVQACCGLEKIELVRAAVTHDDAKTKTFFADHCDAGRLGIPAPGSDSITVNCVRLRDVLKEGCDFLKLDIEGAEVDVIIDCADLLPRVSNIFVEYHSFAGREQRLHELMHVLEAAGFRLHIHSGKGSSQPFCSLETFLGMDMQLDIWGIRRTEMP